MQCLTWLKNFAKYLLRRMLRPVFILDGVPVPGSVPGNPPAFVPLAQTRRVRCLGGPGIRGRGKSGYVSIGLKRPGVADEQQQVQG